MTVTPSKKTTVVLDDGRKFKTLNDIAHMRKRIGILLGGTGVQDADWRTFIELPSTRDGGTLVTESAAAKPPVASAVVPEASLTTQPSFSKAPVLQTLERAKLSLLTVPIIPAMLHSFREILDNCVDEFLKGGHCTFIEVTPTGPYSFSVKDNGRGIPPNLFHIFMAARSGSNFDDDHISRGQNGVGSKGVRAVSAFFKVTSRYDGRTFAQTMTIGEETRSMLAGLAPELQNHFEEGFDPEQLKASRGINPAKLMKALEADGCIIRPVPRISDPIGTRTGTLIEVTLNPFVFSETKKTAATKGGFLPEFHESSQRPWISGGTHAAQHATPTSLSSTAAAHPTGCPTDTGTKAPGDVPGLPISVMEAICRETAIIFPKLKIQFNPPAAGSSTAASGVWQPAPRLYSFPKGLLGLADALGFPRFRMQTKAKHEGGKSFECEALLMAGEEGLNLSFVNGSSTKGGTHVDDLLTIIADEIRTSAREIKKLSKEIDVTRDDVRRATFLFVDVRMTAPSFSSQTKEILTDTWIKPYLKEMVQESVKKIIRTAPEIIDAIVAAARARHESKENKEAEKQLKKGGRSRPLKLVDANSSDRRNTLLYLAEGDSAAAGFRSVRDEKTMGILPLKGVVMNCANMPFAKAIKNDEIAAIIQSAQLPIPSEEKPKDFTPYFNRIVILTDADVDGAHIRSLLLTFFCTYWPWLAKGGHLYRAIPPLFELMPAKYAEMNEDDVPESCGWPKFAGSDQERDELLKKYPKEKLIVSRNKGLGEQSIFAWRRTLIAPECLVRLDLDEQALEVIAKWSDKDAGAAALRREDLKAGMSQRD